MKFKILSIDGGGIKGLYSSTILEHLESKFGCCCSDYFDMVCGTSTGGLIALALSQKIPASEISKIYTEHGKKIFPKQNKLVGLIRQTFWKGKFKDEALKKVLTEIFGERVIGESNNLLCIPSYSFKDARPWVFKYDHKEGNLDSDDKAKHVDVALATSAAPTYLPLAEIDFYDYKQFIDGGVWANNPSLLGLIEALTYFVGKDKLYDGVQIHPIAFPNVLSPLVVRSGPTRLVFRVPFCHHFSSVFLPEVLVVENNYPNSYDSTVCTNGPSDLFPVFSRSCYPPQNSLCWNVPFDTPAKSSLY